MRKIFAAMTFAAFALLTSVTLGFAADKGGPTVEEMFTSDAPVSAGVKWTGFYVGAHAGLTSGDNEGVDTNAALVGIHGGYDYHLPGTRIVVGAMFDYTYSGMKGGHRVPFVDVTLDTEYDIKHQLSASARLGYLVHDRLMVYAMGGYTKAYTSDLEFAGIKLASVSDLDGWHVGAGAELRLGDHWALSAQYRLTDFDDSRIADFAKLDTRDHSARLGATYRF